MKRYTALVSFILFCLSGCVFLSASVPNKYYRYEVSFLVDGERYNIAEDFQETYEIGAPLTDMKSGWHNLDRNTFPVSGVLKDGSLVDCYPSYTQHPNDPNVWISSVLIIQDTNSSPSFETYDNSHNATPYHQVSILSSRIISGNRLSSMTTLFARQPEKRHYYKMIAEVIPAAEINRLHDYGYKTSGMEGYPIHDYIANHPEIWLQAGKSYPYSKHMSRLRKEEQRVEGTLLWSPNFPINSTMLVGRKVNDNSWVMENDLGQRLSWYVLPSPAHSEWIEFNGATIEMPRLNHHRYLYDPASGSLIVFYRKYYEML